MIALICSFLSGVCAAVTLILWWAWPREGTYEFKFEDGRNPLRTETWEPMSPYEDDRPDRSDTIPCDECDYPVLREYWTNSFGLCLKCEMADDEQRMEDRDKC